MSGLFGIYHRDQRPVDTDNLMAMAACMKHRGPDGSDIWHNGHVGLGHCMLQTTPESLTEQLPYANNEAGLFITADARIDNRNELASRLGISIHPYEDLPDSQLILAAYQKWGKACVDYLLGDFSFVIWDSKKQQLFCARDHLGVKPFYYHLSERLFVFASEVRAILKVPHVPHHINEDRIADFLVNQLEGIDKTSTFYESIYRLPPAHSMLISREGSSIFKYWELDPEIETRFKSEGEYIEAFSEIFTESVRARLRCNGQAASMLSGGIDSSSIVGVANQIQVNSGAGPLRVYSGISVNGAQCRETHFIKSVRKHCDLELISVHSGELQQYKEELQAVFDMLDEPYDAHMTLIMLINLMAQSHGNKVLLDGIDGDLVHSLPLSYPAFLLRKGNWIKAISEINGLWRNTYDRKLPLIKVLLGLVYPVFNTLSMRYSFFSGLLTRKTLNRMIINREFANRVDIQARLKQLRSHSDTGFCSTPRVQHIKNVEHPYLTVGLERYDRVAALCSVEPRHPLLDKRLVEFSVSLPWDLKVRHGWTKFLLRRAGEALLPGEIVWRIGREHLGGSFTRAWMQNNRDKIEKEIINRKSLLNSYVDNQFLDRIATNGYTMKQSDNESKFWDIFQLANWIQRQSVMD